jgi:hypothetical protein
LTTGSPLGRVTGVGDPEERLFALFDDLEQQAEAAFSLERDAEVADRAQAEYAEVTLASRLMASIGEQVTLRLAGVGQVTGTLERVAEGWCLLAGASGQWVVRMATIQVAAGLSARSVPEAAWPATARLGLGSALRGISADRQPCRLFTTDGAAYDVQLDRVGADFFEAFANIPGDVHCFAFSAVAALSLPLE